MSGDEEEDGFMMADENDAFKILIATDIHLGFMEKHPIRGNDSFTTFEEILKYGKSTKADFILLGGDLFHENKPSRKSLQRCMDLLRKYCLGPEENKFEFLSDPEVNFKECATPNVNFEDPNLRISLPVFSIHGNHDDPCGEGNYSVMDMLASSGFVNYFGKVPNFDTLNFAPILLRKGDNHVAIYGIGSMNDDRLFRLFEEEKVQFEIPAEVEDEWFNILVLHQNRARHGCKNYAGEKLMPQFMDLVFWGHEHECRIDPEESLDEFRITQPGSSVATSLSPGEAVPKHIGLLNIIKKEFFIEKLPLKTVRPFVFDTLSLDEFSDIGYQFTSDEVVEKVKEKIEDMLMVAETLKSGDPEQPTLPLLRLRIEHESEQKFSSSSKDLNVLLALEKRVANPDDVVKLVRKRTALDKIKADVDEEAWDAVFNMDSVNMVEGHLENLLVEYYQQTSKAPLSVMHERTLAEGVRYYVEKNHDEAFRDLIHRQVRKTKEELKDTKLGVNMDRASFREAFETIRLQRSSDPQEVVNEALDWLTGGEQAATKREPRSNGADETVDDIAVDNYRPRDPSPPSSTPAVTTRGRGRGRAARTPKAATASRARGRGRASRAAAPKEEDDDIVEIPSDDDGDFIPATIRATPQKQTATRAGRGGTATRGASTIAQAFARQSQALPSTSAAPATQRPPARKTARGVCYVSDSD